MDNAPTPSLAAPKPARRKRPLWRRVVRWAFAFLVLWLVGTGVATTLYTRRLSGPTPEPVPKVDWGDLETVRLTTLAVRDDPWCKLAEVEDLHHRIESHARLVVFETGGHGACSRSDPRKYDAALLELLARTDDRRAP